MALQHRRPAQALHGQRDAVGTLPGGFIQLVERGLVEDAVFGQAIALLEGFDAGLQSAVVGGRGCGAGGQVAQGDQALRQHGQTGPGLAVAEFSALGQGREYSRPGGIIGQLALALEGLAQFGIHRYARCGRIEGAAQIAHAQGFAQGRRGIEGLPVGLVGVVVRAELARIDAAVAQVMQIQFDLVGQLCIQTGSGGRIERPALVGLDGLQQLCATIVIGVHAVVGGIGQTPCSIQGNRAQHVLLIDPERCPGLRSSHQAGQDKRSGNQSGREVRELRHGSNLKKSGPQTRVRSPQNVAHPCSLTKQG